MSLKQQIVQEARTWLGTAFHHQGRLKKTEHHHGGCDCLGLIVGVAQSLDLKTKYGVPIHRLDQQNYTPIPDGHNLEMQLAQNFSKKEIAKISPGDLALLAFAKTPQHLAIVGEIQNRLTLIHAYSTIGFVCEHTLDAKWHRRVVSLYSF